MGGVGSPSFPELRRTNIKLFGEVEDYYPLQLKAFRPDTSQFLFGARLYKFYDLHVFSLHLPTPRQDVLVARQFAPIVFWGCAPAPSQTSSLTRESWKLGILKLRKFETLELWNT